ISLLSGCIAAPGFIPNKRADERPIELTQCLPSSRPDCQPRLLLSQYPLHNNNRPDHL
ncbi:hypothetical protein GE21DRAFT_1221404, partial [Neurospora crassa]